MNSITCVYFKIGETVEGQSEASRVDVAEVLVIPQSYEPCPHYLIPFPVDIVVEEVFQTSDCNSLSCSAILRDNGSVEFLLGNVVASALIE